MTKVVVLGYGEGLEEVRLKTEKPAIGGILIMSSVQSELQRTF